MSRFRGTSWPRGALAPMLLVIIAACSPMRSPAPVVYGDSVARPAPSAASRRQASSAVAGRSAVVRKGDTLYRLSRRYHVALRDLIVANGIRPPYRIRPGQRLRLPKAKMHTVRAGETLHGVSRRYGVDMRSLVRANTILPPYRLAAGDRLRLPDGREATPRRTVVLANPNAVASAKRRQAKRARIAPIPAAAAPSRWALAHPPPRAGKRFQWPVRGRIAVGYGPRGKGLHNDGINILAPRGALVRAAENGIVAYSGNELRGFGNLLLVKHAGGWISAYAHTERVLVRAGQRVRRGQRIARVGNSGSVVKPQLHFELRRGRRAVNPIKYLSRARAVGALSPTLSRGGRRGPG